MSFRWPLVLSALCVALAAFCASQWVRESELRAELRSARVAERAGIAIVAPIPNSLAAKATP